MHALRFDGAPENFTTVGSALAATALASRTRADGSFRRWAAVSALASDKVEIRFGDSGMVLNTDGTQVMIGAQRYPKVVWIPDMATHIAGVSQVGDARIFVGWLDIQ